MVPESQVIDAELVTPFGHKTVGAFTRGYLEIVVDSLVDVVRGKG